MSDEIKRRIAALLRKARDAGASEAEAMAAAERAAALMREHRVSVYDVDYDEAQAPIRTRGGSPRDMLWASVAVVTNCGALYRSAWNPVVVFVGRAPGPEIAVYLVAVLDRAIDREIAAFKLTPEYKRRRSLSTRRAAVADFTAALVGRLSSRLASMFRATMSDEERRQANRVRDQRFQGSEAIQLREHRTRFGNAAWAGARAGDRVQLAHGVTGGRAPQQIGRE